MSPKKAQPIKFPWQKRALEGQVRGGVEREKRWQRVGAVDGELVVFQAARPEDVTLVWPDGALTIETRGLLDAVEWVQRKGRRMSWDRLVEREVPPAIAHVLLIMLSDIERLAFESDWDMDWDANVEVLQTLRAEWKQQLDLGRRRAMRG